MENYKIIQIIPNNQSLISQYKDESSESMELPIVCFALVEYEDGEREVKAMDMDHGGTIDFIDAASNFIGINY